MKSGREYPCYLGYRTQRQFSRGLGEQTIRVWWPRGDCPREVASDYTGMLQQMWDTPRELFRRPTYAAAIETRDLYLFSPYMLLVDNTIYYKTAAVAEFDRKELSFLLRNQLFEQELREVLANPRIIPYRNQDEIGKVPRRWKKPAPLRRAAPRPRNNEDVLLAQLQELRRIRDQFAEAGDREMAEAFQQRIDNLELQIMGLRQNREPLPVDFDDEANRVR